jgi:hypothetical protein
VTASYFKTKYFVGETVAAVTRSCLEMGGAHALFKGSKLELLFRDGVTATIHHPPSDYCLSEASGLTPSKYPTDRLVSAGKEGRHEASTVQ